MSDMVVVLCNDTLTSCNIFRGNPIYNEIEIELISAFTLQLYHIALVYIQKQGKVPQ